MSAGIAGWIAAALIFTGIIARYFFNFGIIFAVEYATYLTAFIAFVGGCYTQYRKGHIHVDLVVGRLPKRVQQYLGVITLAVSVATCFAFLYWSLVMVKLDFEWGTIAVSPMATPLVFPHSFMVLGLLLLVLLLLVQLGAAVKGLRHKQGDTDREG